ncbi:MAG: site-2 protease family protein, partial [Lachnospiraceae bacterium]|nr:site-2 protease family protein [Lachnospiraceae bacterium]
MGLLELLTRAFVVVVCLPVHESAHAWTADRLGDSTGRINGRISLNPMRHLDLWGTLMIFMAGIGFAKPVPVNTANFKSPKQGMALTALAGPVSNLLMALVLLLISRPLMAFAPEAVLQFLWIAAYINISLAVFNLIPIPPLDGSKVAAIVLPDDMYRRFMQLGRYSVLIIWGAIYLLNNAGFSP